MLTLFIAIRSGKSEYLPIGVFLTVLEVSMAVYLIME